MGPGSKYARRPTARIARTKSMVGVDGVGVLVDGAAQLGTGAKGECIIIIILVIGRRAVHFLDLDLDLDLDRRRRRLMLRAALG